MYGKTFIFFKITSLSQYTTICSFHILIRFSMNTFVSFSLTGRPKWTRTTVNNLSLVSLGKSRLRFIHGFELYLVLLVGPSGLEPPTSCLSGTRSNLLSYEPMWLVSDFSLTWFFRLREQIALLSLPMSALSYFPVPSPAKYFHHCRA